MRTTIDMPDQLVRRAKSVMAKRGITFRSLVIDALEQALEETPGKPFVLRDASAGYTANRRQRISSQTINQTIDQTREPYRQS
ncbi:MAG TPA: hypothetical protein PKE26_05485 [Kiritimatiellia bacterium]|nr:hypothetical protein [Kiritimatiellia bacterium]HMO98546.1 hypothetical protein [Kiritimatiellia bacterium]